MNISMRNLFKKMSAVAAIFVAFAFFAFVPGMANAQLVTYTYTGNPLEGQTEPHVTGTVTIDIALGFTGEFQGSFTENTINDYPGEGSLISATLTAPSKGVTIGFGQTNVDGDFSAKFVGGNIVAWILQISEWVDLNTHTDCLLQMATQNGILYSNNWDYVWDPQSYGVMLYDSPGTWTSNAPAVPIPAAFWLLGSGLVGLVGMRKRIASNLG